MEYRNIDDRLVWQGYWFAVYVANLLAPLIFGSIATSNGGFFGMALGIAILWLAGQALCARSKDLATTIVPGAVVVALTQLFPITQFYAGLMSLKLISKLGQTQAEPVLIPKRITQLGGFLATLITGGQLLFLAWLIGIAIRVVRGQKTSNDDPLERNT